MSSDEAFYQGQSDPTQCEYEVTFHSSDGSTRRLPPRLDLANHSPTGLSWGYAGSGPAQCALAVLAHATDDKTALKYYQQFKHRVVARFEPNWKMTHREILDWVYRAETVQ